MTIEKAFYSCFSCLFPKCSHDKVVCRGQWFWHAVLLWSQHYHSFQACVKPPETSNFFTLSNICELHVLKQKFSLNVFQICFKLFFQNFKIYRNLRMFCKNDFLRYNVNFYIYQSFVWLLFEQFNKKTFFFTNASLNQILQQLLLIRSIPVYNFPK